jgi:predicted Ser/Thr protein kinase
VKIPKTAGGDTYDKETAEVLAKGVADFCIADNTLIYTNGKRVFAIDFENGEVKKRKLLNTDFCIKLGAVYSREKDDSTDFFNMI